MIKKSSLHGLPIIIASLYYCLPIVFSNFYWGYALILILAYIGLNILSDRRTIPLIGGMLFLALAITFLLRYIGDIYDLDLAISKYTSFLLCVILPILMLYNFCKIEDTSAQCRILIVIACVFAYTMYCTYKELQVIPHACRMWELQTTLYKKNVGHFDFSYACTLFASSLYFWFKVNSNKHTLAHWISLGCFVATFYMVLLTQYTMALLVVFIQIAMYGYYSDGHMSREKKINRFLLICLSPLIVFLFLKILVMIIPYEGMQKRLNLLLAYMTGGDYDTESTESRLYLYTTGFQYFMKSFLQDTVIFPSMFTRLFFQLQYTQEYMAP